MLEDHIFEYSRIFKPLKNDPVTIQITNFCFSFLIIQKIFFLFKKKNKNKNLYR